MSTPTPTSPDACTCPLCGKPNGCVMAMASQGTQALPRCWCVDASFSAELLARVPVHAQRKACICAACAQANTAPTGDLA